MEVYSWEHHQRVIHGYVKEPEAMGNIWQFKYVSMGQRVIYHQTYYFYFSKMFLVLVWDDHS